MYLKRFLRFFSVFLVFFIGNLIINILFRPSTSVPVTRGKIIINNGKALDSRAFFMEKFYKIFLISTIRGGSIM